jgi:hypothetical protein
LLSLEKEQLDDTDGPPLQAMFTVLSRWRNIPPLRQSEKMAQLGTLPPGWPQLNNPASAVRASGQLDPALQSQRTCLALSRLELERSSRRRWSRYPASPDALRASAGTWALAIRPEAVGRSNVACPIPEQAPLLVNLVATLPGWKPGTSFPTPSCQSS